MAEAIELFGRTWQGKGRLLVSGLRRGEGIADDAPLSEGAAAWADWLMASEKNRIGYDLVCEVGDGLAIRILTGQVDPAPRVAREIVRLTDGKVTPAMFARPAIPAPRNSGGRGATPPSGARAGAAAGEGTARPSSPAATPEHDEVGRYTLVRGLGDRRFLTVVRRDVIDGAEMHAVCVGPLALTLDRHEAQDLHRKLGASLAAQA